LLPGFNGGGKMLDEYLKGWQRGTEFDRCRYVYSLIMLGFAGVAISFTLTIAEGRNPVTPELYGPAVYAIPALFWSLTQASTCIISSIGCAVGGKVGALISVVGSAPAFILFVLLWVLSLEAEQGTLVIAGTRALCVPLTSLVLVASFRRVTQ
jgi:hypothetical protein